MQTYVDICEYPFEELERSDPNEPIILDTETAGWTEESNFVIYYSWASNDAVGSGAGPTTTKEGFRFLQAILDSPRPKVFHNITADLEFIRLTGLCCSGRRGYCTLLGHALLDEYHPNHGLKQLQYDIFKKSRPDVDEMDWHVKQCKKKNSKNLGVPQEVMHKYSHRDALDTLELWNWEVVRLKEQGLWELFEVTMDAELAWYQMELDGIEFDSEAAQRALDEITPVKELMEQEIHEAFGEEFNISSPQQLGTVLKKHLPLTKKTSQGWATDKDTLRAFRYDPRVQMVLGYKMLAQTSSKIRKRIEEGSNRLYPEFSQVLVTGRSSCSGVPLQQIAKRAGNVSVEDVGSEALAKICSAAYKATRAMWIPAPGATLLTMDYEQGEYRVAAHYTGSPRLIALMQDPTKDFHEIICELVFNKVTKVLRDIVKHISFGILYFMAAEGIARTIAKLSGKDLKEFTNDSPETLMRKYEEKVPELRIFQQQVLQQYKLYGFVKDVFNRRYRTLPYWFKKVQETDDYAIINYLCQGTLANMKRHALARLHKEVFMPLRARGGRSKMVIEIHDEFVFEIYPEDAEIIRDIHRIITDFPQFDVPFTTAPSVGPNLLEVQKMTIDEAIEACRDGRFIRKVA